jgi:secreted trypsin-like serine protease
MKIRLLTGLGALAVLLATAVPALAIVGGEPDNGAHPYVAAISNGSTICTGAAISPTVLVTAAHCFDFPTQAVRVIFDENFRSPTRTLNPGTWYAHPQFCPTCDPDKKAALPDVAVVVLAQPVSLPRYAQLPQLGAVDRLGKKASVDIVGYGTQDVDRVDGEAVPAPASGLRMLGKADLLFTPKKVGDELLKLSAWLSRGRSASCFGDSGGPILSGDTILGVTSFNTNDYCRVATYGYRIDTPLAQSFIAAQR